MQSLLDVISPSGFRQRLETLCAEDPSKRVLSWILGPGKAPGASWSTTEKMLEWAHCIGVLEDCELGSFVPHLPAQNMRHLTADPEAPIFLWAGLKDLSEFLALFAQYGHPVADRKPKVLDFGCGCGRLARFLDRHPGLEGYASDVNPDLVDWCSAALANIRVSLNAADPPLPFETGTFDLVYSISVFTHLPQHRAHPWLAELGRVLTEGGILILTTHGYPALELIRSTESAQKMFQLDAQRTAELIRRLPAEGCIYFGYEPDWLTMAKAGEEYGSTFLDPSYIDRHWNSNGLEVLSHVPGGLRGWQDTVILRRG